MTLETDLENLDNALRQLFQAIKRPSYWQLVLDQGGFSIDRPAAAILLMLYHDKQTSYRVLDLAARLGVEAPSVTRKTQELETAGLISRTPGPTDRRSVELLITPKGRALANRLLKARAASLKAVLDKWPASKRHQFITYLSRFSDELATSLTTERKPSASGKR